MKSFIKITLAASLSLPCQNAFSGPMDQARDQVKASLVAARAHASNLVELDRQTAFRNAVAQIAKTPNASEIKTHLVTQQKNLQDGFQNIADIEVTKITDLKKTLNETYDSFVHYVSQRFDASFTSAQASYDFDQALGLTINALYSFEAECQTGHSSAEFNTPPEYLKSMPPGDYYLKIYFDDSSHQNNVQVGGISGADQKQTFLNDASQVSLKISTTAYSIAGSAAASPAVVSVAMAAAPWTLGLGVALGVAAAVIAHEEEMKMDKEIADANDYLLQNMAASTYVASAYRDICSSTTKSVKSIRETLTLIQKDPQQRKEWTQKALDKSSDIDQWLKDVQALKAYEASNNTSADAMALQKKVIEETNNDVVTLFLVRVLTSEMESLTQNLAGISWTSIDTLESQAFQKLLKIVNLMQVQLNQAAWSKDGVLMKEQAIDQEFVNLRAQFQKVLALEIKQIFGREELPVVNAAENDLLKKVTAFNEKYAYIPSVRDLYESTLNLVKK